MDRVARSLRDLLDRMDRLEKRRVGFRSLTESIDTGTAAGRLIMHVVGAIAEFERQLTKERTTAGMAASKRRGVTLGAPRKVDVEKARQRLREGAVVAQVAREQGVTPNAIRNYISSIEVAALHAEGARRRKRKR